MRVSISFFKSLSLNLKLLKSILRVCVLCLLVCALGAFLGPQGSEEGVESPGPGLRQL